MVSTDHLLVIRVQRRLRGACRSLLDWPRIEPRFHGCTVRGLVTILGSRQMRFSGLNINGGEKCINKWMFLARFSPWPRVERAEAKLHSFLTLALGRMRSQSYSPAVHPWGYTSRFMYSYGTMNWSFGTQHCFNAKYKLWISGTWRRVVSEIVKTVTQQCAVCICTTLKIVAAASYETGPFRRRVLLPSSLALRWNVSTYWPLFRRKLMPLSSRQRISRQHAAP